MKKNPFIILLIVAGLFLSACEKFLDVKPRHAIPDDAAIVDANSAEQAVRGLYREAGTYIQSYVLLNLLSGGDVTFNNVGDPHLIISHAFRSDNAYFDATWASIYRAINQANLVIQKLPEINDPRLTPERKSQLIGEALFFRALAFFDLARVWGGVPLKLDYTENLNQPLGLGRSTLEDTYKQVDEDLKQAYQLIPASSAMNRIRVGRDAVQALRSRLYLYQGRFQEAKQSASGLIDKADYELVFPFSAWFKGDFGTKESILEIAYSSQNQNGFRNNLQHQTRGGNYSYGPKVSVTELLEDPAIGGGANGRRSLVGSITQAGATVWYGDLYFRSPATDPLYVLRIAEQYLIRAEARLEDTEDVEGALADINAVRTRANLEPYTVSNFAVNDLQALYEAIEKERRFEFLFEGDRWPDLVRTGRAKQLFELQDYKLLYPIPIDEVIIGGLTQNPEYQ